MIKRKDYEHNVVVFYVDEGEISFSDFISLMNVYLNEWSSRDAQLWKQIFTYFIACLVVMVLPFTNLINDRFPDFPLWLFPAIGMVMSLIFFYIGRAYSIRLKCVGDVYMRMINMLPKDLQRGKVLEATKFKPFNWPQAKFISLMMFVMLISFGSVLLYWILSN
jgi:hypothetical protein